MENRETNTEKNETDAERFENSASGLPLNKMSPARIKVNFYCFTFGLVLLILGLLFSLAGESYIGVPLIIIAAVLIVKWW